MFYTFQFLHLFQCFSQGYLTPLQTFCFAMIGVCLICFCLAETYLYMLIMMEVAVLLISLLFLICLIPFNGVSVTFFVLLFAAGETAILLAVVVTHSGGYRFTSQTQSFNSFY